MAVTSYTTLKAAITDWSKREDVFPQLDTIIDFAEKKINASLRIRENEERATLTASTSSRFLNLPDGFLEARRLDLISGANCYKMQFAVPSPINVQNAPGRPSAYTITSQIEFDRVPDSAYSLEINYYKEITSLSSSQATNDILTKYPDLYLSACMTFAHKFGRDWEEVANWERDFQSALIEARRTDRRGRVGPGARMKSARSTP